MQPSHHPAFPPAHGLSCLLSRSRGQSKIPGFPHLFMTRSHLTHVHCVDGGSAIPTTPRSTIFRTDIFQVGSVISLLALIPLFFINDKK